MYRFCPRSPCSPCSPCSPGLLTWDPPFVSGPVHLCSLMLVNWPSLCFPQQPFCSPLPKIPTPRGFPDLNIHRLGRRCELLQKIRHMYIFAKVFCNDLFLVRIKPLKHLRYLGWPVLTITRKKSKFLKLNRSVEYLALWKLWITRISNGRFMGEPTVLNCTVGRVHEAP